MACLWIFILVGTVHLSAGSIVYAGVCVCKSDLWHFITIEVLHCYLKLFEQ